MVKELLLVGFFILIVGLIFGPFLIPVPPLEGTKPAHDLAEADSRYIEVDGIEIHYKERGDGENAVILLHGFGSSLYSWREVIGPLSEYARVIAFDRPAFGLTERPLSWEGKSPYASESQPDFVVHLMDKLGINQAILVGNSAGGSIAMDTFLRFPSRVSGLILVDPAVYHGEGPPSLLLPVLRSPQFDHIGPLIARRIKDWGRSFAESAWHEPSRITDQIWAGYTQALMADNWDQALWEFTISSKPANLARKLGQFDLPVLVITGDDDQIVPMEDSVRLARELPSAELVIIPGCGHVPHEECPSEFLKASRKFLQQLLQIQ